jgi:hypothetical protein
MLASLNPKLKVSSLSYFSLIALVRISFEVWRRFYICVFVALHSTSLNVIAVKLLMYSI